jgi:dienelactone hydrolase
MKHQNTAWLALLAIGVAAWAAEPADPTRVFEDGKQPADARLGKLKNLDGYFPMTVPKDRTSWERRRQELREQVLVALGLWPMPEKVPLKPTIHGKIERDDYTVEKVFFASMPGHYVTGNLYRPKALRGKAAGVLCPHGHWTNGRFCENKDDVVKKELASGAEKFAENAKYHLQARCAHLARLGCVVFHYDMVGYADSQQIEHRQGFLDVAAELRLQSFMGLQTFNSIRALDFLESLPDVDAKRLAITGASGGGTQSFILAAIDDRLAAAFPAVMVSTAMQGGCICENCSYLRIDAGNIDITALFAPRPLALSGAKDWTIDIEKKGLPELKAVWKLYGAEDKVEAKCWPEFGHNYNQVAREFMYAWFNEHLKLGHATPIVEKAIEPIPPKELSVFDAEYPLPKDAVDADRLRTYWTAASDRQIEGLIPRDADRLAEYRRVIGSALRAMIVDRLPDPTEVKETLGAAEVKRDGVRIRRLILGRKGAGEQVPAVFVHGEDFDGTVVVWVHPRGKASLFDGGKPTAETRKMLDRKAAILAPDVLFTGELVVSPPPPVLVKQYGHTFIGYNFGYNRPLLANRVRDILTTIAHARGLVKVQRVHLVGWDEAGPWVVLARALCGDAVGRTAADAERFDFDRVASFSHPMMLPGALKYGGMSAFAGLIAPHELYLHDKQGTATRRWLEPAYKAAGKPENLQRHGENKPAGEVLDWLLH